MFPFILFVNSIGQVSCSAFSLQRLLLVTKTGGSA